MADSSRARTFAAAMLAVALLPVATAATCGRSEGPGPPGGGTPPGAHVGCPGIALLGVYHPARLHVLRPCRWFWGTVSRVNIQISPSGILTDASALAGEDVISETTPEGTVLRVNTKAKGHVRTLAGDSEELIQYDMRLTSREQAELQIVGSPTRMPAPAPWKLERKRASP